MRTRVGVVAALAALALQAGAAFADDLASPWAEASRARARLVAAGPDLAGLEIRLAPEAITYWRDPGDAGVPPTFDFAGSTNLASAEPLFPAPNRIREADGSEAFGWAGGVTIPIRVKPVDPAKPVTLALHVNYAVCEKLCLPAEAKVSLTLPKAPAAGAETVRAALATVPRTVEPGALGTIAAAGADAWRFCPAEAAVDLFVEPPPGWWVTSRPETGGARPGCFTLSLRQKPDGAAPPVPLRLTLTGAAGARDARVAAPAL